MTGCFAIGQWLAVEVPFAHVRRAALSLRHELLDGCAGIDLPTRRRAYPAEAMMSPREHLAALKEQGVVGSGLLLTQTCRNGVQHPRCPVFTREHGVCQRAQERVAESRRPYYGIGFVGAEGFEPLAVDFREPVPSRVEWWLAGIPVVWNGRPMRPGEAACEVGDQAHLWELAGRGPSAAPAGRRAYREMQDLVEQYLHAPAGEANRALLSAAKRLGLRRQRNYLHNILAVRSGEALILAAGTGALEELGGRLCSERIRATHAVVVDNGGSCEIAVQRPGADGLLPLIHGPNYRQQTALVLAVYQLDCDDPGATWFQPDRQLAQ